MNASTTLSLSLIGLTALLCCVFLYAVHWTDSHPRRGEGDRRWLGVAAGLLVLWLLATGLAGGRGVLTFDRFPPTMFLMLGVAFVLTMSTAFSPIGTRLCRLIPLPWLVGFQGFRVAVELWLHRGYTEGVFPSQMTYSGMNFDIVSGITAVIVAWMLSKGKAGRPLVMAWNILGLVLLATIVTIAILSAPVPFQVFTDGPSNVWVTGFPGIWLPTVLVQAALLGHVLVFRRIATVSGSDH